jgi:hypothetical protein
MLWQFEKSGSRLPIYAQFIQAAHQRASLLSRPRLATHSHSVPLAMLKPHSRCFGRATLQPYFDQGVKKVVVSAPVKDPNPVLNVVYGCNEVSTPAVLPVESVGRAAAGSSPASCGATAGSSGQHKREPPSAALHGIGTFIVQSLCWSTLCMSPPRNGTRSHLVGRTQSSSKQINFTTPPHPPPLRRACTTLQPTTSSLLPPAPPTAWPRSSASFRRSWALCTVRDLAGFLSRMPAWPRTPALPQPL